MRIWIMIHIVQINWQRWINSKLLRETWNTISCTCASRISLHPIILFSLRMYIENGMVQITQKQFISVYCIDSKDCIWNSALLWFLSNILIRITWLFTFFFLRNICTLSISFIISCCRNIFLLNFLVYFITYGTIHYKKEKCRKCQNKLP